MQKGNESQDKKKGTRVKAMPPVASGSIQQTSETHPSKRKRPNHFREIWETRPTQDQCQYWDSPSQKKLSGV
jgi:hypothetical protein